MVLSAVRLGPVMQQPLTGMMGAHRQQQALQKPVKHGGREGGGSGVGSSARGGRGRKRKRGERKEAACGRVGIYRGRVGIVTHFCPG